MHRLEEASSGEVRQTTSIIAIGLVGGERLERLVGLPALDADHWETKLVQPVKQDRRHSPRLEYIRRQLGAFDNSPAIASAVDAALLSRTTAPSRSRTQTCVSSIEISRPAK